MAHKKGVGSSRNGRDSNPQYRGFKKFGGERFCREHHCPPMRHKGTRAGMSTRPDFTIYSLIDGVVKFEHRQDTLQVSVYPTRRPRGLRKTACRRVRH